MTVSVLRILVSESGGFSTGAAAQLRQVGELTLADLDRPSLLASLQDIDVLWVRLRHRIDAEVLANAPCLKIIVTATTGLNHIDLEAVERRGIRVLSLRGESAFLQDVRGTAEHTVALALALVRRLPTAAAHVLDGGWNRDLFRGHELYQKTVGVIGYGRLGRLVARYLTGFDARILFSDPHVDTAPNETGAEQVSLERLLEESDLVTLHVDLTSKTRSFFGADQFAAMKQGAFLVNTSRGEVIEENALLQALRSGRLGGAALDVLCDERSEGMEGHPLVAYARERDNLVLTPHIGGCTFESMEKTEIFLAQKLIRAGSLSNENPSVSTPWTL